MKKTIHPQYVECTVTCTCGNTFQTRATVPILHTEICSACHPFFSGKQKLMDSAGRVERFQKRYGNWKEKAAQQRQKVAQINKPRTETKSNPDAQAKTNNESKDNIFSAGNKTLPATSPEQSPEKVKNSGSESVNTE